jgi:hemin uptake protein HemP
MNPSTRTGKHADDLTPHAATKAPRTIPSTELLRGDRLVIVRHKQEDYRLQVTATGKLILTK